MKIYTYLLCLFLFSFTDLPKFGEPLHNSTIPIGREAILSCVVDNLQTYKVRAFPRYIFFFYLLDKTLFFYLDTRSWMFLVVCQIIYETRKKAQQIEIRHVKNGVATNEINSKLHVHLTLNSFSKNRRNSAYNYRAKKADENSDVKQKRALFRIRITGKPILGNRIRKASL